MMTLSIPGPKVLVTGGLGYIGSHAVVALSNAGYRSVIVDNLSNSDLSVLPEIEALCVFPVEFVNADVRDAKSMDEVLGAHKVAACMHFAGLKAVADSVATPLGYYDVNVGGSLNLLRALRGHGVSKMVFSSSATVYGSPHSSPVDEMHAAQPVNPYGRTKWMAEQIFEDACAADPALAITALRYFNPAGAHPSGRIGERPSGKPNNLMPYISQVANGQRELVEVFGGDYDTEDGTGVRDYIHVSDLAQAHVLALRKLSQSRGFNAINIGTGRGYSVLEVLAAFQQASGRDIPITSSPGGRATSPVATRTPHSPGTTWAGNQEKTWRRCAKTPGASKPAGIEPALQHHAAGRWPTACGFISSPTSIPTLQQTCRWTSLTTKNPCRSSHRYPCSCSRFSWWPCCCSFMPLGL